MSEEDSIIEIQKPKFSKLAIVAVICSLLSVISPYVGRSFVFSILPWAYGMTVEQFWYNPSTRPIAGHAIAISKFFAPILLCMASVLSWVTSLFVIKRSKGKLRGIWLALGCVVVSIVKTVLPIIDKILLQYKF